MFKKINYPLIVKGVSISKIEYKGRDYISLTDIAKFKNQNLTGLVISHWISTKYTIEFIGLWEKMNNSNFNVTEFSNIKSKAGSNGYVLTSKQLIEKTNAIGIISKPGRYGGTYAHKDIAFEFASWISAEFKLYLIKEFQRLKEQEIKKEKLNWDFKRNLAAINYRIHTDAIKENLIPQKLTNRQVRLVYASEADILNMALFGITAKEWRENNPKLEGNLRDYANVYQLICLSNLESLNAEFIRDGLAAVERLKKLNNIAINQMKSLIKTNSIKKIT